jgi:hypothetical protein
MMPFAALDLAISSCSADDVALPKRSVSLVGKRSS